MLATAEANRTISRNLCRAMSAYSQSSREGKRVVHPGLTIIDSGLDYAAFNAAILPDPLQVIELEALVARAARHFASVKRPWGCWLCDDLLSAAAQSRLTSLMAPHGLRLVTEHQGMVAESIRPMRRRAPDLEMRAVEDGATRAHFAAICAQVFSLPSEIARGVYESRRFWMSSLAGWVAYERGTPVSIAASSTHGDTIGIYSVATLASYQHRGFGEAVTRHAISRARLRSRAERVILQSTPSGLGLYARMGFQPASRFSVFMT